MQSTLGYFYRFDNATSIHTPFRFGAQKSVSESFTEDELHQFHTQGFFIQRGMADAVICQQLLEVTKQQVKAVVEPVEFEADVKYPGAPLSREAVGGKTIRRLKNAIGRHPVFMDWLTNPHLVRRMQQLLGTPIVCPLAHHNCVMTKQPEFSSSTGWHQDIRYWSFERPELISVWLPLVRETPENGCLRVIPGSHAITYQQEQFDEMKFFRDDLPANQPAIESACPVELNPGDVLFFHCRTLHAAGRNTTSETKYAVVLTFSSVDNPPKPGSRSASMPEIVVR